MSENKAKEERSTEWSLSLELAKSNKRMFITLICVIISLVIVITGSLTVIFVTNSQHRADTKKLTNDFLDYLSQYDFTDYTVDQGGEWGNTFIGGANEGDLTYGAENPSEETNPQE